VDEKRNLARHTDFLSQTELLAGVGKLLSANGRVVLILPYTESKGFIAEALTVSYHCNRMLKIKPAPLKKVNRVVMEFSRIDQISEEYELIIRNEDSTFSDAYKKLTKDYYLAF
jgi:tRNA1Val (adenine37-N6)-methyltransferase